LILFGAHDKVVPPENASLLAEKIANSQIVIFPDARHSSRLKFLKLLQKPLPTSPNWVMVQDLE